VLVLAELHCDGEFSGVIRSLSDYSVYKKQSYLLLMIIICVPPIRAAHPMVFLFGH